MSIKKKKSKEEEKKKKKKSSNVQWKKEKKKKKGVKKSNVDEFIVYGHFRSKIMHNFSLRFSLHFGEKTFW